MRFLLLSLTVWSAATWAETIRVAQEVELAPTAFETIIDHFDFEKLDLPEVREELNAIALRSPPPLNLDNWMLLPESLRNQLGAGLNLPRRVSLDGLAPAEAPKILVGEFRGGKAQAVPTSPPSGTATVTPPDAPRKTLLGLDGQPLDLAVKPGTPANAPSLIVPTQSTDWPILEARWAKHWKSLDSSDRRQMIPWPMVPRAERVRIAMMRAPQSKKGESNATWLPLRKDAPEGLRDALDGIVWGKDQNTMEFQHSTHTPDRDAYLRKLERFLAMTHQPVDGSGYGSYHLNISQDGRDLKSFAQMYNFRLLLQRLEVPHADPFDATTTVHFQLSVENKGLVHLQGPRFSVRTHYAQPRAELEELVGLLQLPEADALRRMALDVQQRLTHHPDLASRIAAASPSYLYALIERTQNVIGPEAEWKISHPTVAKALFRTKPTLKWVSKLEVQYQILESRSPWDPEARLAFQNLNAALLKEMTPDELNRRKPDLYYMELMRTALDHSRREKKDASAPEAAIREYVWSRAEAAGFASAWGRELLKMIESEPEGSAWEARLLKTIIPPPEAWSKTIFHWFNEMSGGSSTINALRVRLKNGFYQHYATRLRSTDSKVVGETLAELERSVSVEYDSFKMDELIRELGNRKDDPNRELALRTMTRLAGTVHRYRRDLLVAWPEIQDPELARAIRAKLSQEHIYQTTVNSLPPLLKERLYDLKHGAGEAQGCTPDAAAALRSPVQSEI